MTRIYNELSNFKFNAESQTTFNTKNIIQQVSYNNNTCRS